MVKILKGFQEVIMVIDTRQSFLSIDGKTFPLESLVRKVKGSSCLLVIPPSLLEKCIETYLSDLSKNNINSTNMDL
jgi:hypothetical protein